MTAAQTSLVFDEPELSGVLAHLGADTVRTVENIVAAVASTRASFTWEHVEALLPAGVLARIHERHLRKNAPGALMKNAAKRLHLSAIGYAPAENPNARGRAIRVYGGRAA